LDKENFTCVEGSVAMKYLGITSHSAKLRNIDWGASGEKMEKKLGTWQRKVMSHGGKLILIRGSLGNVFF
jgi:hypothetical protein